MLTPARWIASSSLQNEFNSQSKVELVYLEDMLELSERSLTLKERYNHIDSAVRKRQLPFGYALDHNGLRKIDRSEYSTLAERQREYDVYLNFMKFAEGRIEGAVSHNGTIVPKHLTHFNASIIAKLMLQRGTALDPEELCPPGISGRSARKAVERARRFFDVHTRYGDFANPGWKNFHTLGGKFTFDPPDRSKFLLLLSASYKDTLH
jgi:hypothetical protein